VTDNGVKGQCLIYPNPTNGLVTFAAPGMTEDIWVSIINIHGKLIRTFSLSGNKTGIHQQTVDLSGYPEGLYIISFRNKSQLWNEKLVIQ
jgi:hypothetical protein